MKILVTGGSGTIGGYVLRELLAAGHCLTCFSRTAPRVEGTRFIEGDIMNPEQIRKASPGHDAVIHLAAVPGPGRASPAELVRINVIGTINVLEASVEAGVGRFVFASSGGATGFCFQKHEKIPRYLPLDEEHASEPQDEYGLSKLLGELTCRRYTDAYGIRTICLRIHNNWYLDREGAEVAVSSGWANKFTVEELWAERYRKTVRDEKDGWPVPGPPPPLNVLWAVTDARDAAQAFRLAVENEEIEHEVFLITGDDTCSMLETPELLSRHFPDVPLRVPLEGHASLWSHEKATRMLRYKPRYTWRESDFRTWLESSKK
jgi:nucleoside-diphosphate-sugar epimerase